MNYNDYLKLDTLVYIWQFSNDRSDVVNNKYRYVSDFVRDYGINAGREKGYATMFNAEYNDDYADNGGLPVSSLILTDPDLQKNGKLGKLEFKYRSSHDDRYSSVCLVEDSLDSKGNVFHRNIYVIIGGNYVG